MSNPFKSDKKPFFTDMVYGIKGTFIREEPLPSDSDYINIYYIPIGGIMVKKYPDQVHKDSVIHIHPQRIDIDGVQKYEYVVKENVKGESPYGDMIGDMFEKKFAEYNKKIKSMSTEIKTAQHRASTAKKDTQKQVAEHMELKKRGRDDEDEDGERHSGFGMFRRRDWRSY